MTLPLDPDNSCAHPVEPACLIGLGGPAKLRECERAEAPPVEVDAMDGLVMRIAVSGTHVTGKSTLVEALSERLPNHTVVPEPYQVLEDRGYEFEHPPSVEDFVAQLRQSLAVLRRPAPNMIVDRCPLDFLGYIYATPGAERFDVEPWRRRIAAAMASLDLVVALRADPRYEPEALVEDEAFRLAVDGWLRDIVDADSLDLCDGVEIVTLGGPWDRRAETVMAYIGTIRGKGSGVQGRS